MNKQELIDSEIHRSSGFWPKHIKSNALYIATNDIGATFTLDEFNLRARELGYINGYRYGVEYPTNGEKPDLPDGCKIQLKPNNFDYYGVSGVVDVLSTQGFFNNATSHFKVVDNRYKPLDTSYLDAVSEITESKSNTENVSDWYDYEAQKAVALPPVAIEVIAKVNKEFNCYFVGKNSLGSLVIEKADGELICYHSGQITFKPLDYNRKAEAGKKRVVDDALALYESPLEVFLHKLYDAGYLRMPDGK